MYAIFFKQTNKQHIQNGFKQHEYIIIKHLQNYLNKKMQQLKELILWYSALNFNVSMQMKVCTITDFLSKRPRLKYIQLLTIYQKDLD